MNPGPIKREELRRGGENGQPGFDPGTSKPITTADGDNPTYRYLGNGLYADTNDPKSTPQAPAGYKMTEDGVVPVNRYGQPYTEPQKGVGLPADGRDYWHVPGTDIWTPIGKNDERMVINGVGKEPGYIVNSDGSPEKLYRSSLPPAKPITHSNPQDGNPNDYGLVNIKREQELKKLASTQHGLVEDMKKFVDMLEGNSTLVDAARNNLKQVKASMDKTLTGLSNLTNAQGQFKNSVTKFQATTIPKYREIEELKRQLAAPRPEDPNFLQLKLNTLNNEIKAAAREFVGEQPPIRDRAKVPSGMHLSQPPAAPSGPGPGGPVGQSPGQQQPNLGGGVIPGGAEPSPTATPAPSSPTQPSQDKQDLLKKILANPAAQQMQTPNANMPMSGMPALNQQQQGRNPYGTPENPITGEPMSDGEFNDLLNQVRGNNPTDDPNSLSPTAPTLDVSGNPNATPMPTPWFNGATTPTSESAATNTPTARPVSTAPTLGAKPTSGMPMMPMMPMMPGGAGQGTGGKDSNRPKIVSADTEELYGENKIKHTDPIITPRTAGRET